MYYCIFYRWLTSSDFISGVSHTSNRLHLRVQSGCSLCFSLSKASSPPTSKCIEVSMRYWMIQFCAVSSKHGGFSFVVNVFALSIVHKGFDFVVNACALPFEDVACFSYCFLFIFLLFSYCFLFILRAEHIVFLFRQQAYHQPTFVDQESSYIACRACFSYFSFCFLSLPHLTTNPQMHWGFDEVVNVSILCSL